MTAGLVCTVTTVKDTLPRVQQFVAANLAGGVDHMFVLLDEPDQSVLAWLGEQPNVTGLVTDDSWWVDGRPRQLNDRQRMNANAVLAATREVGWVDWLIHLDGDEVAQIDRAELGAVPDSFGAIRLSVLEAVAQRRWDDLPTWFKRPLNDDELALLVTLGLIERPRNGTYFHGHVDGKSGVRPSADAWLTIHDPVDSTSHGVATYDGAGLHVLHYESYSGEEFARKWQAMAAAGAVRFRPARQGTHRAIKALLERNLPEELTERFLMQIFDATTADDLDALRDLGLLVEADPRRGTYAPAEIDDAARQALATAMARVSEQPKQQYRPPANRPVDRDAPLAKPQSDASPAQSRKAGRRFGRRS